MTVLERRDYRVASAGLEACDFAGDAAQVGRFGLSDVCDPDPAFRGTLGRVIK